MNARCLFDTLSSKQEKRMCQNKHIYNICNLVPVSACYWGLHEYAILFHVLCPLRRFVNHLCNFFWHKAHIFHEIYLCLFHVIYWEAVWQKQHIHSRKEREVAEKIKAS